MITTVIRRFSTLMLILLGAGLTACASVPVQEMSDARQAVQAALAAGAAKRAPEKINAAQTALRDAETQLRLREYRRARRSALEARSNAIEAQRLAQGQPPGS